MKFNYFGIGLFMLFLITECSMNQSNPNKQHRFDSNMETIQLKIQINNEKKQPVADALVAIMAGPTDFPDIAAVSNEDGYIELSVSNTPGIYTLGIHSQGVQHTFQVKVPQSQQIDTLILTE